MSLLLVGAGHVFRLEAPITDLIQRERPDVVALELDPGRYQALLQRAAGHYDSKEAEKNLPRTYRRLARFQEDIAQGMGTEVGSEMLAAARAAQSIGGKVALIDRNAEESVRRLLSEMAFTEKVKLLFSGIFARFRFRKSSGVESEIARYQAAPGNYLDELGASYPTLKRVLLDERNEHMAKRLRALLTQYPSIVAVVGDGHVQGLSTLLADLRPRIVRLQELRDWKSAVQWKLGEKGDAVTFSFDQKAPEGDLRPGP